MSRQKSVTSLPLIVAILLWPLLGFAQDLKPIQLPAPQLGGGKPLMQALKDRTSARAFSAERLPPQLLANLLWAGYGVNRSDTGGRTAPSASNSQETEIYVAMANGLYVYEPKAHALRPILADDIRALTGRQAFVKEAPVNLVYVADLGKMTRARDEDKEFYAAAHTGFISQNVYLYCASEGLATVVRASFDRPALAKAMKLRPEQKITLSQTVGYPKR
jgi:SagB-type dehydrogenase family enzyme